MKSTVSALFLLILLFIAQGLSAQDFITELPELQKAKVIAVGESAHGVKDFTKYKIDVFKELVERGVTKTFLIETNYSAASAINDYINSSISSGADSVMRQGLYGIWVGSDMAELIEWMRTYNLNQPAGKRLSYMGFDAQSAKAATVVVEKFLQEKEPAFETKLPANGLVLLKELGVSRTYNIRKLPKEDQDKIEKTVSGLRTLVDLHAPQNTAMHLHMKVIEHTLKFEQANPVNFTNIRDAGMAEIVMAQLQQEDKPVFLWAHNGHINKSKSLWYKPLGYHLSGALGKQYVTIGLDFHEGEIKNTYTTGTTTFKPLNDPAWIGHNLNNTWQDITLIRMKDYKSVTIRNIGSGDGTYKTKGDQAFDFIVYFKNVGPM